MAAGGVYWISGVLLAIAPGHVQRRDLSGRERVADLLLRVAAGILLFVIPMLSAMLILTSKVNALDAWMQYEYIADIRSMLTFTVFLPLLSVNLAAGAWLTRPTPAALRLGGVSLLLLIVTMTTHYAPFSTVGRDEGVAEERDATGPMCSPERTRLTPNRDRSSPTGIYIPKDLEEALTELDRLLPACFVPEFLKQGPDHYHLSVGLWPRNNWGLWHGSRLAKHFNAMEIHHPDDMSGIILTSYYRRRRRQPLRVEEQVDLYQTYWEFVTYGWWQWRRM